MVTEPAQEAAGVKTPVTPVASANLSKAQITILYDAFGKDPAMQKEAKSTPQNALRQPFPPWILVKTEYNNVTFHTAAARLRMAPFFILGSSGLGVGSWVIRIPSLKS